MKNKLIKSLSLSMACLTLILLFNVINQNTNSKPLIQNQVCQVDEWPPW